MLSNVLSNAPDVVQCPGVVQCVVQPLLKHGPTGRCVVRGRIGPVHKLTRQYPATNLELIIIFHEFQSL